MHIGKTPEIIELQCAHDLMISVDLNASSTSTEMILTIHMLLVKKLGFNKYYTLL